MAKSLQCLIGKHDWHVKETEDRDRYAECSRCGKHDWTRALTKMVGTKSQGVDPPPGSYIGF